MEKGRMSDFLSKAFFTLSMCGVCLLLGMVVAYYQWFPYPVVRDGIKAAAALVEVATDDSDVATISDQYAEPTVINHTGADDGALILVSGGPDYLEQYNEDGGCLAWLMDRSGKIKHTWKWDPNLWSDAEKISIVPGKSFYYVTGVHLLPDGDLLAVFQGKHTWPFSVGIVRFDKDSNVKWKKECYAHHWFTVTDDDKIIVPTLRLADSPMYIGDTDGRIKSDADKIMEDVVTIMTLDGEVLEEKSLLEAMHESGLVGLYQGATELRINVFDKDPLHLNDVQEVGQAAADAHDWLNADDILVSFRSINTLVIFDRQTWKVKWYVAGSTMRQHSPRMLGAHDIVVFDNRAGDRDRGGTRIARINLDTRLAETVFPTKDSTEPAIVDSGVAGHLDINGDGTAVLMAVTHQGTIYEVDAETGDLLWEYICVDPSNKELKSIYTAKYCYDASFEMNQDD